MDARPELYPHVPRNDEHADDPLGRGEWGIDRTDAADGVELANSVGPPRYHVGTGGRILTPGEQLRWSNYKRAIEMIRELDPHAPRADLYSAPPSTWVPDYATDINPLWDRFRELRTLLGRRDLERHHPESTQFAREFCDIFGIDGATRDLHSYYLPWREHRGVGGLHPYWNRDFKSFFGKAERGRVGQENLEDFLVNQMDKYGQLLMP
jgi:hypothetical protein